MKHIAILCGAAALGLAGVAIAQQSPPPPPPPGAPMMDMMGGKTMTRAEAEGHARKMFAAMDVNKDGKIDAADRAAREAEHFRKLDTDGNGSLSPSEFAAKPDRKPEGGKPMGGRMGHGAKGGMGMMMLRMADTNKDGAVTEAEFLAAHARHFDMMDANKDGSVTPEERKAAMAKMRDHMQHMRGGMRGGMGGGMHGGMDKPQGAGHQHPAG